MRVFLIAGCIYLVGTALVLALKPEIMFTREGVWKEFGIGRNPATHTWIPLWLFTIVWAILSYILASILSYMLFAKQAKATSSVSSVGSPIELPEEDVIVKKSIRKGKLPRGYYILNTEDSETGIPSYIYLGKNLPTDD